MKNKELKNPMPNELDDDALDHVSGGTDDDALDNVSGGLITDSVSRDDTMGNVPAILNPFDGCV